MPTMGVTVAVIENDKVLLIKRLDFALWGLPGGNIEAGESVAQAAMREVREETGLEVILTRLVGIYSLPWRDSGDHSILFAAKANSGVLRPEESEVLEVGYFDPDQLPVPFIWWHRQQIQDALSGVGGSVAWSQNKDISSGQAMTRQELYELRNLGKVSTEQIYMHFCQQPKSKDEVLEVGSE